MTFEPFKCPLFRNTFVQGTSFLYMQRLLLWTVLFPPSTSLWSPSRLGRVMGTDLHLPNLNPIGTLKVKSGWKRFTVFGEKVKTLIIVIHTRRELWEGITWLMREGGVGMVKHPLYDDEALHGRQLSSKRRSIDHVFYIDYRFILCVLFI